MFVAQISIAQEKNICIFIKMGKIIKDHTSQAEFQNSFYSFQNHFRIGKYQTR